ncbi:MAG: BatD family protein, partial [Ignavibacterium sp.]|nr:BatD family protein [Ignavibacterium sp.]MDW8374214.1 BatD family protein [Ignavibacteriales bacterium]
MKKVILLIILFTKVVYLQSFTASVDNTTVSEGEPFQVEFTFSGKDINALSNFNPPNFGGLKPISGPNHSTSMQIINGNVSASRTYSYILVAPTVGKYTIGSATVEYKGEKLKTEPIQITVVKGTQKPREEKRETEVNIQQIADNLFIRAIPDKNKAYIGEQITVTYKLYTRLNIAAQMSISKLPQYVGFWTEEIETARNLSFTTEVINGKRFNVAVLKRAALFPTQSGTLEVTPFELTVPIEIRKNRSLDNFWDSFFDDPFNRQIYEYKAKSNSLNIDVQQLPENDKPSSFNGAVGKYNITASVDREQVKVNEPITLKIKITGTGNISLLQAPIFDLPAGFEKYEPKINEEIIRTSKISGSKTFEYLIIPRAAGVREINPIEFSYFDPDAKKYFTLKTSGFNFKIEQNDSLVALLNVEKEAIKSLGSDIRSIKTSNIELKKKSELLINSVSFWILVLIPLIGFVGILMWNNHNQKITSDIKTFNYLRAEKIAKKSLKKSLKYLTENRPEDFYTEIAQALFGYLENKLDISKSDFTIDLAVEKLNKLGIEQSIIDKMK